jgi:hypothetical protein
MAKRIVDGLEAVKIQDQQCRGPHRKTVADRQGITQHPLKAAPVHQTRQFVMFSEETSAEFGSPANGNIFERDCDTVTQANRTATEPLAAQPMRRGFRIGSNAMFPLARFSADDHAAVFRNKAIGAVDMSGPSYSRPSRDWLTGVA